MNKRAPKTNLGLTAEQRGGSIELLNVCLANVSILTIKTKKAHWDVVGPQFRSLHLLWDEQYTKLAAASDEIAERIRALGGFPVATAKGFLALTELTEQPGEVPNATENVIALLNDHETIVRGLRSGIDKAQDRLHDAGTADFLTQLLRDHEQMAWMLRSFVEGEQVQPDHVPPPARATIPTNA